MKKNSLLVIVLFPATGAKRVPEVEKESSNRYNRQNDKLIISVYHFGTIINTAQIKLN
jgi:hypothetical protein